MNRGTSNEKKYLFSIDLEDVRLLIPDGKRYNERVVQNTLIYLEWLSKHGFKCTFFVVGNVAEIYPDLIQLINNQGHEIACHTHNHITLDKQSPEEFRKDIERNIEALIKAGAKMPKGFRAPVFSLTEKTKWAFKILSDLGFLYSSSVLPAKNPLYGWESFGMWPQIINDQILEVPMTLDRIGPLNIPFAGGIYFRVLPEFIIRKKFLKISKKHLPVLGYFHPYDIDVEQERFMHPGIKNNQVYNFLMYYNRHNVLKRLDKIINEGFTIIPYQDYIKEL